MENQEEIKVNMIGIRKYEHLTDLQKQYNNYNFSNPDKEKKTLSEIELQQIKSYENKFKAPQIDEEEKKKYMRIVREGEKPEFETIQGLIPNYKNLSYGFLQAFETLNAKKFELTTD